MSKLGLGSTYRNDTGPLVPADAPRPQFRQDRGRHREPDSGREGACSRFCGPASRYAPVPPRDWRAVVALSSCPGGTVNVNGTGPLSDANRGGGACFLAVRGLANMGVIFSAFWDNASCRPLAKLLLQFALA